MKDELFEDFKDEILGMLARIILGRPAEKLAVAEKDLYLWQSLIKQIKGDLD